MQTNRANLFVLPTIWSNKGIGNNLFGSQAAMTDPREEEKKTKTQQDVDDFLYELPERTMPDLELGDGLLNSLGTNAQNLFDVNAPPSKKEEEEEILKDIMDEYEIEKIRDTMDESAQVPESIYFFYGGDSDQFVNALEFLGLSPINREFGAFLLSDLGRQTMTQNKHSIHVESGEIFYDNHNTGENFYSFLLTQQNDKAAYVPKKFSYRNSFEVHISSILQSLCIDDQEKFDLLAFKNSKYLFYCFNDFIKADGNPRYKLLHTKKMLDTVGLQKVEQKNKQFLLEKIIHGIEFENLYTADSERKPEIMSTIEGNYRIARRVYQQLYLDSAELFADFIRSLSIFEQRDMDEDLYDLGLIQFYLEENDDILIKNSISELYYNLSYMTLSSARDFKFEAVTDLTARLSILLKHLTLGNRRLREIENKQINKKINEERVFEPKIEDPLDDVIEIIDMPDVEHKKSMFPYVEPTVETADEIDKREEIIDTDFIDLQNEFNKVNDVAAERKKQKKVEVTIECHQPRQSI